MTYQNSPSVTESWYFDEFSVARYLPANTQMWRDPTNPYPLDVALLKAIAYARLRNRARRITLPPGFFSLVTTIDLRSRTGQNLQMLSVEGASPSPDDTGLLSRDTHTCITWEGANGADMFQLSRNQKLSGMILTAAAGKHLRAAIVWDAPPALDPGPIGTDVSVENVGVYGNNGLIDYGLLIGPTTGVPNLEHGTFKHCTFANAQIAAVKVASDTQQSKYHLFERCAFVSSPRGIDIVTGSVHVFHCFGASCPILFVPGGQDTLRFDTVDSEDCGRFIDQPAGFNAAPTPIVITNSRISCSPNMAADGGVMRFFHPGPIQVEGCLFENANVNPALVHILSSCAALSGVVPTIQTRGNVFLNNTPVRTSPAQSGTYWTTIGDMLFDATRIPSALDTFIP